MYRHKWFVFLECCKHGIIWRGLIHDWDKCMPRSFIAYAKTFFNPDGSKINVRDATGYYQPMELNEEFRMAWFRHAQNKHHWQHWVLATDEGEVLVPVDKKSMIEMFCDWHGASRAQGNTGSVSDWWIANNHKMRYHPESKKFLEEMLKNGGK